MVYGWCVVGKSHLAQLVRLYEMRRDETKRVTSETRKGKRFIRLTNKVVRGAERNLLYMGLI